jgi:hypothetical protein
LPLQMVATLALQAGCPGTQICAEQLDVLGLQ